MNEITTQQFFQSGMTPMRNELDSVRIAVTSDSISNRNHIQRAMEQSGLHVILNEPLTPALLKKLSEIDTDVLLLDVEPITEDRLEYLDRLLEEASIPIIINDVSALTLNEPKEFKKWHNTLLRKISEITGRSGWNECTLQPRYSAINVDNNELAKNVWVLGASLGGPDAVKRFLNVLPDGLPVAFVLAQHLGANFVSLLAEQLDRCTPFKVIVPNNGHVFRHQEVLVMPTDTRMTINPIGAVELQPVEEKTQYAPSIDMVIRDIAQRYKKNAGAIIFSGMCDDGVKGCQVLQQLGGRIWTQDSSSCVISAMRDNVAQAVDVEFSATPEKLAEHLVQCFA